jgi:hypothetical protein
LLTKFTVDNFMENPTANNQTSTPQQSAAPVTPPPAPTAPAPPQASAEPTPVSTRPNKNVNVPKYCVTMASDPTMTEQIMKAIEPREEK